MKNPDESQHDYEVRMLRQSNEFLWRVLASLVILAGGIYLSALVISCFRKL